MAQTRRMSELVKKRDVNRHQIANVNSGDIQVAPRIVPNGTTTRAGPTGNLRREPLTRLLARLGRLDRDRKSVV